LDLVYKMEQLNVYRKIVNTSEVIASYEMLFGNTAFTRDETEADIIISDASLVDSHISSVSLVSSVGSEKFSDDKGHQVYVSYGNDMSTVEVLINHLNFKGFYDTAEGELEVVPHITNLLVIREGSFLDRLMRELFPLIESGVEFMDYIVCLLKEFSPKGILSRRSDFYVSFTTRDFSLAPRSNMEVREFLGDRAMWSVLTMYFIKRFPNLTNNQMTNLHRDYASKNVQASISSSLFMFKFIRTKSRITINTHEDLFEAFIGTLFEIPNSDLHKKFLYAIYDSFELQVNDGIPPFTEFSENMRILCGSVPAVKKTNSSIRLVLHRNIESILGENVCILPSLKAIRLYNALNKTRETEEFFKVINATILEKVGKGKLLVLRNRKIMKDWTEEQVSVLARFPLYSIHLRNLDENWLDTYYILDVLGVDYKVMKTYSTENLENSDMVETLLSLICDGVVVLKPILATETILLSFRSPFIRFVALLKKMDNPDEYVAQIGALLNIATSVCPFDPLSEFIGNRFLLTFGTRILNGLEATSEFQLNVLQKYYFSKAVKREIQKLMKCPITIDELLGRCAMIDEVFVEALINVIYLNLEMSQEACISWAGEVRLICPLSKFCFIRGAYSFVLGDVFLQIVLGESRLLFEKRVYDFLVEKYGVDYINVMLNSRWKNMSAFGRLALLLKNKGVGNWLISTTTLRRKTRYIIRLDRKKMMTFESLDEAYDKLSQL
jgi:hypothetical protein